MSETQTNEEAKQPETPPAAEPMIPWENIVAQVEGQSALNAKSLASNLIVSAQMLLKKMQSEKDLTDKNCNAAIDRMLDLATKADILGDRALVRYEKAMTQVVAQVAQNEKLPVTQQ